MVGVWLAFASASLQRSIWESTCEYVRRDRSAWSQVWLVIVCPAAETSRTSVS